jgi:hypothetical protein
MSTLTTAAAPLTASTDLGPCLQWLPLWTGVVLRPPLLPLLEAGLLLQEGGVGATQLPVARPLLQQRQVPTKKNMSQGRQQQQ